MKEIADQKKLHDELKRKYYHLKETNKIFEWTKMKLRKHLITKKSFYDFLVKADFHLPPYKNLTIQLLKQIFDDEVWIPKNFQFPKRKKTISKKWNMKKKELKVLLSN